MSKKTYRATRQNEWQDGPGRGRAVEAHVGRQKMNTRALAELAYDEIETLYDNEDYVIEVETQLPAYDYEEDNVS